MGRFCIIEGGLQMESRLGAWFAPDSILKNIKLVVSKRSEKSQRGLAHDQGKLAL